MEHRQHRVTNVLEVSAQHADGDLGVTRRDGGDELFMGVTVVVVSDDAGQTWREAGGGLPAGTAVAIDPDDPDLLLYASESRLFLSEDGGRFWRALEPELIGITALAFS